MSSISSVSGPLDRQFSLGPEAPPPQVSFEESEAPVLSASIESSLAQAGEVVLRSADNLQKSTPAKKKKAIELELDSTARLLATIQVKDLVDVVKALRKAIQEKKAELKQETSATKIATLKKELEALEKQQVGKIKELGRAVYNACSIVSFGVPYLIARMGQKLSEQTAVAGVDAFEGALSFVLVIDRIGKLGAANVKLEALKAKMESAEDHVDKQKLANKINKRRGKIAQIKSDIAEGTLGGARLAVTVGASVLQATVDKGLIVGSRALPAVQQAIVVGGIVTAAFGVALAAHHLRDNRVTCIKIAEQDQKLRPFIKAKEVPSSIFEDDLSFAAGLKCGNLRNQREEALVSATVNFVSVVTYSLAMGVGVLAIAGLSFPPATIAALSISAIGLIGYGAYVAYKKRHQIYLYAKLVANVTLQAAHGFDKLLTRVERIIANWTAQPKKIGTPKQLTRRAAPRRVVQKADERIKWLAERQKHYKQEFKQRMRDIEDAARAEKMGITPAEMKAIHEKFDAITADKKRSEELRERIELSGLRGPKDDTTEAWLDWLVKSVE